jgi:hypothetical protein
MSLLVHRGVAQRFHGARASSVSLIRWRTLQRKKEVWAAQKNVYLVLTRESASHWDRHQRHG